MRCSFLRIRQIVGALTVVSCLSVSNALTQAPIATTSQTFKRVGDLEINADVHRLSDAAIRPVVVWIHGGADRELVERAYQGAIELTKERRLTRRDEGGPAR
jgi:hypothetical protein